MIRELDKDFSALIGMIITKANALNQKPTKGEKSGETALSTKGGSFGEKFNRC